MKAFGNHWLVVVGSMGVMATLGAMTVPIQAFTLNATSGSWSNVVGGSSVEFYTIGSEQQVRWGSPASGSGITRQSGLGFTGTGIQTVGIDTIFNLGQLRHFNNPVVAGTAASAANLAITIDFADFVGQVFNFTLTIDETPNVAGTCVYPSILPCADRISWDNTIAASTFSLGDIAYTLELIGFSSTPTGGNLITDLISQEQDTTSAYLFGKLTAVPTTTAIPEPSTIVGLSLMGMALVARRLARSKSISSTSRG